MLSAAELAVVKGIEDSPPEQRAAKFEQAAMKLPIYKLLAGQAMLRREKAVRAAEQATRMAAQGGANTAPQTTVAQDIYGELQGVSSLPIRGDMYASLDESGPVARGAGGGIVAFNGVDQSFVRAEPPSEATRRYRQWSSEATLEPVTDAMKDLASSRYMRDVYERQQARDPFSAEGYGAMLRDVSGYPIALASDIRRGIVGLTGAVVEPAIGASSAFVRGLTGEEGARPAGVPTAAPAARATGIASVPEQAIPERRASEFRAGIAGAGTAPGAGVGRGTAAGAVGGAGERTGALSNLQARRQELQKREAEEFERYRKSVGEAPKATTLEEQVKEATRLREQAMKEAGVKSIKERVSEINAEVEQAKTNRDVDRWLAAAQGFFAMGAGKSKYAMQNIAEGLGVTTTQLRDVEKDYRKGEQLRKDRIAALDEAKRQEALGNFDKGQDLFKEAQRLKERHDEKVMTVNAKLLDSYNQQISRLDRQEADIEQKRIAAATAGAQKEYYGFLRQQAELGRRMDSYNKAVQAEKAALAKINPLATLDPNAADQLEKQAIRNIIQRNPQFAEFAGVDTSTGSGPELPPGVKVTRR